MQIHAAELRGVVVDAQGGERLARVRVDLVGGVELREVSAADGSFRFAGVPAGEYTVKVETVGYRLLRKSLQLSGDSAADLELVLSPDTFRRTDVVEVQAGPFEVEATAPAPAELNLTGSELKNLGTVLMDDPLRAVAALPGVSSNNDFESRFVVRAAPFERVGFYLEDVLMHAPFHAIAADEGNASLSILNGEMLDGVSLIAGAMPARFGDRTAAALEARTREGSRSKPSTRIASGVASTTLLSEGPLANGRGSWLGSVRKSYMEYLAARATEDTSIVIGFQDVQGKLAYNVTDRQIVTVYALHGRTGLDRSRARDRSGVNAIVDGAHETSLGKLGWTFVPSATVTASATAAWLRERFDSHNRYGAVLDGGAYGEWIGAGRVSWFQTPTRALEVGWNGRRMRDSGEQRRFLGSMTSLRRLDVHHGNATRHGAFAEQSWSAMGGTLRGSLGMRFDTHDWFNGAVVSPTASLAVRMGRGPELQLAYGQYVQFPELAFLGSAFGGARLLPERSNHLTAALEQRIGDNTRVRLEAWNRDDRDLLARPFFDPRLSAGRVIIPSDLRLFNSGRGYSRGAQIMIQRRSANRLSGWIGYTLGYARMRDGLDGTHYWSPQDQRHLLNTYVNYRLRPSVSVSGRFSFGSGEPLPGFVERRGERYFTIAERNTVRLAAYKRADVRVNKSFTYDRWKLTLYGEVINAFNQRNTRLVAYEGVNTKTGQAWFTFDRVFPILPAGGVTLEF